MHCLHMVGRFDDPHTGAERSLPDLADALQGRRETALWSVVPPHPMFAARGVRVIDGEQGAGPTGGSLLISGVHVRLDDWLDRAAPAQVILRYNLPNHLRLFDAIARIREATDRDPDLVFVSRAMQQSVALPGRVEPSLIRLDRFLQVPVRRPARPLTVGRLSRDVIEKHSPDDVALYRSLAARGFRVRVMGGTCLQGALGSVPGLELLPAGAADAADFLASLDVFFYRTGSFIEPYGRVVLEAMASGLPVVVAANGGFAEQIHPGQDGVLVQTQEQAMSALLALAADETQRHRMGEAARATALRAHGPAAFEAIVENYTGQAGRR